MPDEAACTVDRERQCPACGAWYKTEERITQRIKKNKKC